MPLSPPRNRAKMSRHKMAVWALRIGTPVALLGVWLYSNGPGGVSPLILPDLGGVLLTFGQLVASAGFWEAIGLTVLEIGAAFVIGAGLGVLIGFWGARRELRTKSIEPLSVWGYMAPLILFYPLFVLWFDIGVASKISFGALNTFFPVVYGALRSFRSVDDRYLRVARAFGASSPQTDVLIKLPAALPMLASSLRIGVAMSVITVILSEMLASTGGLGYLLAISSSTFNMQNVFAIIVAILLLVGVIQAGMSRLLSFDRSDQ